MIQTVKKCLFENELCSYEITTTETGTPPTNKQISVPLVEENTDYQAILQWVADGNTIEEAD